MQKILGPVTMAVRPEASIPLVTSSAVEAEEKPEGPFPLNSHISFQLISQYFFLVLVSKLYIARLYQFF